jgi:hypothetical protein
LRTSIQIAFCLLACLAAGCSTLSVEERAAACAATDWERFGENDGRLGVATEDRADEFLDCKELGQPVNLAAYQAGRAEGLAVYCTAENGYQVGYDGRRYEKVCPPATEPDFLQGYERGRKDRPSYAIYPGIGIGIGSGGVRTRIGVGIGLFGASGSYGRCRLFDHYCW